MPRIFCTDCEGPISKNDNAFELAQHFIPEGGKFFAKLSRYDDYLADVAKKPGYRAGNTLKLIIPFLKAYGADSDGIEKFSSQNIVLMPKADVALKYIVRIMPTFIISTSYHPYINSLCKIIGFPVENTYSTRLSIDEHDILDSEIHRLRKWNDEILALPDIKIPADAVSINDLDNDSIACIKRLDEIFWEELPKLSSWRLMEDVNPVGGIEKVNALLETCKRTGCEPSDVIYVGDSITDMDAFKFVKEAGGMTVSFNGNRYAIQSAEVACLSSDALALAMLAQTFHRGANIRKLASNWDSAKTEIEVEFKPKLPGFSVEGITLHLISGSNMEELISQSENFRKTVRGEHIGRLG